MTDTPLPRRRPYRPLAARTLSRRLDLYAKISTILLGVVLAIYVGGQGWRCGRNPYCYDVMEISGAITALIGVVASFGLRGRFVELIAELVRSGAIERRVGIDNFENAVARSVVRYCLWTIIIVTAAELVAYALAGYLATPRGQIECAFSAWAGSVVGERFGRLGAYARGGNLITRSGGVVVINFWHPDNAGGLLPFSRFYFYTALLSAIPAVWLGVWWVLIPRLPQYRYDPWRLPLGFLWLIVVGIGLWGFMMPIYSVHRAMARAKEQFLEPLGWIPQALVTLHNQLKSAALEDSAQPVLARIDGLEKLYRNAASVNTWPLDGAVIGAVTGLNAAQLLLPVVLKLIAGTPPDYIQLLDKLLEKL